MLIFTNTFLLIRMSIILFFLEGDLLKIPYIQLDKNFITIGGAVQLAGSYEHAKGDDLETAIGIARGFDVKR